MEYSNPEIPEGINTSKTHPLKEFVILTTGVLGTIIMLVFLLGLMAERLTVYIPFSMEQRLFPTDLLALSESEIPSPVEIYLQELSSQLIQHIDLPEDMTIDVHYVDDDVENAFATVGGHVFIHRGLMELLPNENTLSMVLAHEIAHVYHRHPVMALGRGVVITLFLSAISGISSDAFVGNMIGTTGAISSLGFSRKQESEADETALRILVGYYGHAAGAEDLFQIFMDLNKSRGSNTPEFLRTHPLSENRINDIQRQTEFNGWPTAGATIALPPDIFIKE